MVSETEVLTPEAEVRTPTVTRSEKLPIIESSEQSNPDNLAGFAYRGHEYTKADTRFSPEGEDVLICLDPGCPIILGDREFLRQHVPDFEKLINRTPHPIPVRGLGNKITESSEYLITDVYFKGLIGEKESLAKLSMEIHVTEDLRTNMLVGTDVLNPKRMMLDFEAQTVTISNCQKLKFPIRSISKPHSKIKRTAKAKQTTTLTPQSITEVPISYAGTVLPEDRDFLFEPELPARFQLGSNEGVFAHLVDTSLSFVHINNTTSQPVILPKHTRLGSVVEFGEQGGYLVTPESAPLAACG